MSQMTPSEMRADLERKFLKHARPIYAGTGSAYVASPIRVEELDLNILGQLWLGSDWDHDPAYVSELLDQIGADTIETLLTSSRHFELSIWWNWQYNAFRLNGRGYMTVSLWESEEESAEVILGAWEPYNDTRAFEACFVEVYGRDFENGYVGERFSRGARVSEDLYRSALMGAVELSDSNADLLRSVLKARLVDEYIEDAERKTS